MTKVSRLTMKALLGATLLAGPAAADEVNISAILSTTGTYAFVGVPLVNGIRMADEELAAAGGYGDHTVAIQYDDNRSDRQEAISLLTRRANVDQSDLILGPIASSEAMATGPVAVQLQVPMFTVAMTSEVLPLGEWIFKSTETAVTYMPPLANYIGETLQPANCYLVSILDNPGYIIQKDVFRDTLASHGVEIIADEGILASDTDFTALSTKIVDADPECLFVTTPPEQAANIILQARQAGLDPDTIIAGDTGLGSSQFINAAGSAGEGTLFVSIFSEDYSDATRDFAERYQARYGIPPDHWAATGYSMMSIIAAAISSIEGEVTRENLREAMTQTRDVPVLMGTGSMTFGEGRVPVHGSVVMRVRDGGWEVVQ
ncbi:ABC transporter substrate-binding protein [Pararhodobacter sp.]|uniref:ABC transporter substrate-binding protein n=1 Tax=Pararhodobacter sp. TaxID=2127056 RepID=UPI002FE2441A|nr:ABC transporter substrate-binding protein [Pseudomonadota bacterium]